jgi:hypothetical protein
MDGEERQKYFEDYIRTMNREIDSLEIPEIYKTSLYSTVLETI